MSAQRKDDNPYFHLKSFKEFWPYYLNAHSNLINRALHIAGTLLGLISFSTLIYLQEWRYLPLAPAIGYAFSWFGHFVFEKNRPATFDYIIWSFIGDLKMTFLVLTKGLHYKE